MTRKLSVPKENADTAAISPHTGAAGPLLAVSYEVVDIDLIDVPADRLRTVDLQWAEVIGKAMDNAGQLQPIRVARKHDGRYELDFGLHRLTGARIVGWRQIVAGVVLVDDLSRQQRRQTEIFENLIRNELGALHRALNLCELKRVHEALYPETKKGGDRGNQHVGGKKRQSEKISFSQEAAEKTGLSERSIEIAVSIANGLSQEIRPRLVGTWLSAADQKDDQEGPSGALRLDRGRKP